MFTSTWSSCYQSICSISFFNSSGEKIGSGTGFKAAGFLITNNHVYFAPGAASVELSFVSANGYTSRIQKTLSYLDFQARLVSGMPESSWDYAILSLNDEEFQSIPDLELSESKTIEIGSQVAILGYQFEQSNLSMKVGILSSRYVKAGVKYLQIDSSVNQGNSGGPLVNIETNKVVGIITRKATGLSQAFDELVHSFDINSQILRSGITVSVGGVNIYEALAISQEQMKRTALEIKRSANVGIGYAYDLEKILDYIINS